jgi:hypothetical protein
LTQASTAALKIVAGAEKRRLTEQKNCARMGLAQTADSTFEWRKFGAQVKVNNIKHYQRIHLVEQLQFPFGGFRYHGIDLGVD